MNNIEVLRKFFEGNKPLQMAELKALSAEERKELAELAAKELGVEVQAPTPTAA